MPDYKHIINALRECRLKTSKIQSHVVYCDTICIDFQGVKLNCKSIEDSSAYVDTEEEEFQV